MKLFRVIRILSEFKSVLDFEWCMGKVESQRNLIASAKIRFSYLTLQSYTRIVGWKIFIINNSNKSKMVWFRSITTMKAVPAILKGIKLRAFLLWVSGDKHDMLE